MDYQCSICLEDIFNRDTCLTQCNHRYCIDCLDIWFDRGEHSCPMCRQAITKIIPKQYKCKCIAVKDNSNCDLLNLYLCNRCQEPICLNCYNLIINGDKKCPKCQTTIFEQSNVIKLY